MRTCGINQRVVGSSPTRGAKPSRSARVFYFMFYIYIIYSSAADKYYVGYSTDPHKRLEEHNTKPFNTYTSKHRPWKLVAIFRCAENEATAMRIEKFIKKQKSRKLIEQLCIPDFVPTGFLAQLVRVPHLRD